MSATDRSPGAAGNRPLREFAEALAHDLRSPLANVLGFAELLVARPSLDEAKRLDFALTIREEARRLSKIIDEHLERATPSATRGVRRKSSD